MRVLLVAPAANEDSTGEARIAFDWARRLSERHDVTVLSSAQRAPGALAAQLPDARVIEWTESPVFARYERLNAMMNPSYIPFRRNARRWIRAALARGERFDVGHQVAPVSLRYPSPLVGSGVPTVIGPVGGSLESPPAFTVEEGGAPRFTALRRLDRGRIRFDPVLRRSFADAACVVGIAEYVREILAPVPLQRFRTLSDVGIEKLPRPAPGSERTEDVRFLFVGRIIRTKGVRDAVRALALLPRGRGRLEIVGDGYDRGECERLAAELDVEPFVRFWGSIPHSEVEAHYEGADVFLFPSYREAGGIVVVEAMSHGLPLIVCGRGGPASAVDDASGIRVRADDPTQYAHDLAAAMDALARDPARRARHGAAARARVEQEYLWDRRVEWMEALYAEVCGQ